MKHFINLIVFLAFSFSVFSQTFEKEFSEADSLVDNKKFSQAELIYKSIIEKDSTNAKAYNKLALTYYYREKVDTAISILNKTIELLPDYSPTYVNLSDIFYYQQEFDSAMVYIKKAQNIAPDSTSYIINEGSILIQKKELDQALKLFQNVYEKDKNNATALYSISYVYYTASYLDSALKYINLAIDKKEKADFYKLKAEIFYSSSRFSDALFEINKAIDLEGDNKKFILAKAEIYSKLEQYNDVLRIIKPFLDEYSADFYYYAIISYYNMEISDSVYYYLNIALEKDPDNDLFYFLQGNIKLLEKDYNNAYLNFIAAIKLNPKDVEYFYYACESKLLLNTDSAVFNLNNKFYDLKLDNIRKMKRWSKSKKNKYYYKNLLSKFKIAPTSLSIDEYFMLYFGNALQSDFSGYNNSDIRISNAFDNQNFKYCIDIATKFISEHPCSISSYYYLSNSYFMTGQHELALKYLTIYYGFVKGILASGDGNSTESAYIVSSPADEHIILNYKNYSFAGQKLISEGRKKFDILHYYLNNTKMSMYFYINLFYGKK